MALLLHKTGLVNFPMATTVFEFVSNLQYSRSSLLRHVAGDFPSLIKVSVLLSSAKLNCTLAALIKSFMDLNIELCI